MYYFVNKLLKKMLTHTDCATDKNDRILSSNERRSSALCTFDEEMSMPNNWNLYPWPGYIKRNKTNASRSQITSIS